MNRHYRRALQAGSTNDYTKFLERENAELHNRLKLADALIQVAKLNGDIHIEVDDRVPEGQVLISRSYNDIDMQRAIEKAQAEAQINTARNLALQDALNVLEKFQVFVATAVKYLRGDELKSELKDADKMLLNMFNDMRKHAAALNHNVEQQAPEMVAFTHKLVVLIGDITDPNALNPVTPNEGARQIQALYKQYTPNFPNLLPDIGRPPTGMSESRQWIAQRAIELRPRYVKGWWKVGKAIYDELSSIPQRARTDVQLEALYYLRHLADPLQRNPLSIYIGNLVSEYKQEMANNENHTVNSG